MKTLKEGDNLEYSVPMPQDEGFVKSELTVLARVGDLVALGSSDENGMSFEMWKHIDQLVVRDADVLTKAKDFDPKKRTEKPKVPMFKKL